MTTFRVAERRAEDSHANEDTRSVVQKMFLDYNEQTGNIFPLDIVPSDDNFKRMHDCIPLIKGYKSDDEEYVGPLKNKDVLVIGGRRRSRAGTGVEFLIDIEHIDEFAEMLKAVGEAAREYLRE